MTERDVGRPARPLRRDAERNRERILRAAAEVFTTGGLQVSLDDVARQAGVGVGTVYRRFPDKEALVEALFEERIQAVVLLAERALREPDPWAGVVRLLEGGVTTLAGDRGMRETLMYATYGRDRVDQARSRLLPVVMRVVERAQRDGSLRADFRPTDIPLIFLMLTTAAEYADPARPEIWRRYLTLILDGLRPARAAVTPLPVAALSPEEVVASMRSASLQRR